MTIGIFSTPRMLPRAIALAAFPLLGQALQLMAQELAPQYELLGTFEIEMDGEAMTLVTVFDKEYDHSGLSVMQVTGQPAFGIIARTLGPDGQLSRPNLSLSIGPAEPGSSDYEITEAHITDKSGRKKPLRATAEDGTARLQDFTFSPDGAISFSFSLDLARYARDGDRFLLVEDADGAALAGRFEGKANAETLEKLN